ncbi:acyl-CoA N-acyltransferase [Lasiosphaeria miniovina]|uniref:Glycylpeptide N-tetradecanoyltransferase n=1 Tax=Lasiosphaeria miniovina TaxID=1954250 RepID=A0AA40ADV4_9PEZI|nr:acyl-CoA N-acyltransferase [Lasiosphaeria miniovina]KAK0713979.1 acyl-CoA N-acyltransferase [Lasiosphaeria miniovina]
MADESKPADASKQHPEEDAAKILASLKSAKPAAAEPDGDLSSDDGEATTGQGTSGLAEGEGSSKKKKKKSKRNKIKKTLEGAVGSVKTETDPKKAIDSLTPEQIQEFMALNPALANELLASGSEGSSASTTAEAFKKLQLQDIMTGLASSGKNRKDMASYKFWATQPVPQFGEEKPGLFEEGPLKVQEIKDISPDPIPLSLDQFEWDTMDLTNESQMQEVEKLLYGHYVEDNEAMFRFKYSPSLLRWSLMSPGWKKEWHVGIRAKSGALCAFIGAVPTEIRVRDKVVHGSEVNFICVHKKLRGKRLAPVLIKEITRRINREGIWQAIYTGGVVLPTPVSTCRYYHRALNWMKLYEVGFSPCPPTSKPAFQARKFALGDNTSIRGLREMEAKDIDAVGSLLERYLKRYDLTPVFDKEEIDHWLLHKKDAPGEQVVWTYVVEDANGKITDFFSFYGLDSSVLRSPKHSSIKAAYLFYYATETGLTTPEDRPAIKARLNLLVADALVLAKRFGYDVFNALSLMDNGLFLEDQKFGPGDGQLHYYLFNYRANPIHGGVDKKNQLDEKTSSGVGFIML